MLFGVPAATPAANGNAQFGPRSTVFGAGAGKQALPAPGTAAQPSFGAAVAPMLFGVALQPASAAAPNQAPAFPTQPAPASPSIRSRLGLGPRTAKPAPATASTTQAMSPGLPSPAITFQPSASSAAHANTKSTVARPGARGAPRAGTQLAGSATAVQHSSAQSQPPQQVGSGAADPAGEGEEREHEMRQRRAARFGNAAPATQPSPPPGSKRGTGTTSAGNRRADGPGSWRQVMASAAAAAGVSDEDADVQDSDTAAGVSGGEEMDGLEAAKLAALQPRPFLGTRGTPIQPPASSTLTATPKLTPSPISNPSTPAAPAASTAAAVAAAAAAAMGAGVQQRGGLGGDAWMGGEGEGGGGGGGEDGAGLGADFFIRGTCEDMCPEAERLRRVNAGELHILERVDPANSKLTSPELIVKKSVRNYDDEDKKPSSFRTLPALNKTMEHLRHIMDRQVSEELSLLMVQGFLWDRYREIRREVNAQRFNLEPAALPLVIAWNEEVCRFLLACSHELIDDPDFLVQLNQEQMNKVLMDLLGYYSLAHQLGIPTPCSAEFKCYHALMLYAGLVNKHNRKTPNKLGALEVLRTATPSEQASPWTQVTLAALGCLSSLDVRGFMRLLLAAPYTLGCVLYTQYPFLQVYGLAFAAKAYDASQEAGNLVPVSLISTLGAVGKNVAQSRARNFGAEVVESGDGDNLLRWGAGGQLGSWAKARAFKAHCTAITALNPITSPLPPSCWPTRFPHLNTDRFRPTTSGYKKKPHPAITKKSCPGGCRSASVADPPDLTPAFLDIVASLKGLPPGSVQPAPAIASHPTPLPLQPSPLTAGWCSPVRQKADGPREDQRSQAQTLWPALGAQGQGTPATAAGTSFGAWAEAAGGTSPTQSRQRNGGQGGGAVFGSNVQQQQQQGGGGGGAWGQQQQGAAAAAAVAEAERAKARALELQQQAEAAQQGVLHAQQVALQSHLGYQMHVQQVQRQADVLTSQLQQQLAAQAQQIAALEAGKAAADKEVAKARLQQQAAALQAALSARLTQRALAAWHSAAVSHRAQAARVRQQLSRCSVSSLVRGKPAAGLLGQLLGQQLQGGQQGGQQQQGKQGGAAEEWPGLHPPSLPTPPAPPPAVAGPRLLTYSAAARARLNRPASAAPGVGGVWAQAAAASPLGAQVLDWLQLPRTAACNRDPTPSSAGPPAAQLTRQRTDLAVTAPLQGAAQKLAVGGKVSSHGTGHAGGGAVSAGRVAAEQQLPATFPSTSMAAAAGILMLVGGPDPGAGQQGGGPGPPPSPPQQEHLQGQADDRMQQQGQQGQGQGQQQGRQQQQQQGQQGQGLPSGLSAELHRSWSQLRCLLERLGSGARVPVVLLALTSSSGVQAVAKHLEHTAATWPPASAARVACFRVLPLLPQPAADVALAAALAELASHPPAPLLASCGIASPSLGGEGGHGGGGGRGSGGGAGAQGGPPLQLAGQRAAACPPYGPMAMQGGGGVGQGEEQGETQGQGQGQGWGSSSPGLRRAHSLEASASGDCGNGWSGAAGGWGGGGSRGVTGRAGLLGCPVRVSLEVLVQQLVNWALASQQGGPGSQVRPPTGFHHLVQTTWCLGGSLGQWGPWAAQVEAGGDLAAALALALPVTPAPQAVLRAFNKGLEDLAQAVRATASCPAASWGLPCPELASTPDQAAPAVWLPSRLKAAAAAIRAARVEFSAVADLPAGQAGLAAVSHLLHARFSNWVAVYGGTGAGGSSSSSSSSSLCCWLLPGMLPGPGGGKQLPEMASGAGAADVSWEGEQGGSRPLLLLGSLGGFATPAQHKAPAGQQQQAWPGQLPHHYAQDQQQQQQGQQDWQGQQQQKQQQGGQQFALCDKGGVTDSLTPAGISPQAHSHRGDYPPSNSWFGSPLAQEVQQQQQQQGQQQRQGWQEQAQPQQQERQRQQGWGQQQEQQQQPEKSAAPSQTRLQQPLGQLSQRGGSDSVTPPKAWAAAAVQPAPLTPCTAQPALAGSQPGTSPAHSTPLPCSSPLLDRLFGVQHQASPPSMIGSAPGVSGSTAKAQQVLAELRALMA
ncbi:hypothetical protein QJQ45_020666 [Haematococcus lacustris]|nr:hypothetical protein QJQ45_020666 [Haematococcus lacustris]